jgi:glycerol uptake facilitator-like aquaporin
MLREFLAELLATFVLIVFGCGSVAQAVLSRQEDNLSIHVSWGLAVLMGCVIGGKVSGTKLE